MARKPKPFRNKEFYVYRANAARQLSFQISEEDFYCCGGDPVKRDAFLDRTKRELHGTVFERDARPDGKNSALKPAPAIGYLVGKRYLETFRQIAAGGVVLSVPEVIVVADAGRIRRFSNWLFFKNDRFLKDLASFDPRRIKICPECSSVFYGQKNSVYCGDACNQRRWKEDNPEAYRDAQSKRDDQRKQARASARIRKEAAEMPAHSPATITKSKRSARLPGRSIRRKSE